MVSRFAEACQSIPDDAEPFAIVAGQETDSRWSYRRTFKRWFDIGFSLLVLLPTIVFSLLVAILIKLDSRGPVLIKVKRLGRNRTAFLKYKFRTMVPDAEKVLQQLLRSDAAVREEYHRTYKIRKDPRITRLGRWLRFTSLDELPQIVNVLKGDMSWVGPRDILETELTKYGELGPRLLTVQPGITGLWQVSGRSNLSYTERVNLDMNYIDDVSLIVDLKIIGRTIPVILFGDGAA